MGITVVFNAMAPGHDLATQRRVATGPPANTKKTGFGVSLIQQVQNTWCDFWIRAIVKGQRNFLSVRRCLGQAGPIRAGDPEVLPVKVI